MTKLEWSGQQEAALKSVGEWLEGGDEQQVFRLMGYAGTGKTTLAKEFEEDRTVLYGAFTGKAASVLRSKGCDDARTIHSLIYRVKDADAEGNGEPEFELNPESDVATADLVIIDECSMVDEALGKDLLSFGKKVLVLGDPAQLPPVSGAGFFTNGEPDVMLTEIHRQARDNPIIQMSMQIREGGTLELGQFGGSKVIARADLPPDSVMEVDQIIVGLNRTRVAYNRRLREKLGRQSAYPIHDDKLVCLRNDRKKGLFNGTIWKTHSAKMPRNNVVAMQVVSDESGDPKFKVKVRVREEFFLGTDANMPWQDKKGTQEFTYGYALTCHKSQGSQWNNIMVFDESAAFRDDARRWLYTAVTRAAETVTVVK